MTPTGSPVLDSILGVIAVGGFGALFTAARAWGVSHALKALEIEGPRAAAVAATAFATSIAAGKSEAVAALDTFDAAKAYLLGAISGPLDKLKKSDAVVTTTIQGIAALGIQQATKLGVPSSLSPIMTMGVSAIEAPLVKLTEDELNVLADLVTKKLQPTVTAAVAPAPTVDAPATAPAVTVAG